MKKKVCVIGAGPSGLCLLSMIKKLKDQGNSLEVVCYEKQESHGGLWNYSSRIGLDKYGEPVHASQYLDLFSNGPKECLEFPDYTFDQHFGKNIGSFPPRQVLRDYLEGYWKFHGISKTDIKTLHVVRDVSYNKETKMFTVQVYDLKTTKKFVKEFDYVIVASGHFSTPNFPDFEGMTSFKGRQLHSHEFRNAREFTNERVLLIGSSYSAEDIALQLYKFGAKQIFISYRTNPMKFQWPKNITEVPLLTKVDGNMCYFKDDTFLEVDSIIFCTGYNHHFPFMNENLTLKCKNVYFPPNLYRGLQWCPSGKEFDSADGKLFYMGMQDQYYTFTMFMLQGLWIANVLKGLHDPPETETRKKEVLKWLKFSEEVTDPHDFIEAQGAYIKRLSDDIGYKVDLNVDKLFHAWQKHKSENIITYRDKCFASKYTGDISPLHKEPWLKCFDDNLENYIS